MPCMPGRERSRMTRSGLLEQDRLVGQRAMTDHADQISGAGHQLPDYLRHQLIVFDIDDPGEGFACWARG